MHDRVFLDEYAQALEAVNRQVEASDQTLAAIRTAADTFRAGTRTFLWAGLDHNSGH